MSNSPTLQTVERALSFLEYVASVQDAPTVQEVAVALELNITTCYHLMRTLLARDYLERREDATLVLGSRVGLLFGSYQQKFNVDQGLAALVSNLAEQTLETAFLSVLENGKVILKVLAEGSSQPLRVTGLYVGHSGNEHRRASGRAVLAYVSTVDRDAILSRSLADLSSRERNAVLKRLKPELEITRERGWSMDGEESEHGISSVGAPVFDAAGKVYGAVGIVTPTFRMDRSRDVYINSVISVSREATTLLRRAKLG
ncbi:IclR family transcriptional regulator [Paraburkholderia sediminicola]|uniref:IclR family transcriptional regulator n=1 Tax=Paraburkholderia sediminicola TaxID=458836 RepID=UPI0038B9CBC4